MSKVKGSKEYQWRVVKYRPMQKTVVTLLAAVLMIAAMLTIFWLGKRQAVVDYDRALNDLAETSHKLGLTQEAESTLRREIENAKLGTEVDRQSLESVRLELIALRTEVSELEEENQFYRNLMSPEGGQRGLSFGKVELFNSDQPRVFRYKVLIQQLTAQHEQVKGTLNFNIVGKVDGKPKTLALHEVAPEVSGLNIKLSFTYFQKLEGLLTLPEGFEPERVELKATSSGDNAASVDKTLEWSVRDAPVANPHS